MKAKKKRKFGVNSMVQSTNPAGEVQSPGRVVAMFEAEYFLEKMCHRTMDPDPVWRIKFPDWKDKPVVIVSFLEPHRTANFEEWMEQGKVKQINPREWSEDEWRENYEANCPKMYEMCFPYDDLEEIDA
jgi:hypothetical protein